MAAATFVSKIDVDDRGVARIAGTRIKIAQVAIETRHLGWSPEEIQRQHDHLTLAQIHAALTYYFEHQADVDSWIERNEREAHELATRLSTPGFWEMLEQRKIAQNK